MSVRILKEGISVIPNMKKREKDKDIKRMEIKGKKREILFFLRSVSVDALISTRGS